MDSTPRSCSRTPVQVESVSSLRNRSGASAAAAYWFLMFRSQNAGIILDGLDGYAHHGLDGLRVGYSRRRRRTATSWPALSLSALCRRHLIYSCTVSTYRPSNHNILLQGRTAMSSSNQLRTLWYGIFIVLISDANLYDMVVIFFLNFCWLKM